MTSEERAAILAEIDELAAVPERKPLDVSLQELVRRWDVTPRTVEARMQAHVDAGLYLSLKVYDPTVGRICRVFRKVHRNVEGGGQLAREGGGERA